MEKRYAIQGDFGPFSAIVMHFSNHGFDRKIKELIRIRTQICNPLRHHSAKRPSRGAFGLIKQLPDIIKTSMRGGRKYRRL
ncbi:MAG: hypothetical protein JJ902_04235 [Roseibium sp.]|nr:hypothetical protein [Roseibium sp.]